MSGTSSGVSLLGGNQPAASPTAISFSQIASNARVPLFHVEFDNSGTAQNVTNPRTLLVGITNLGMPALPVLIPSLAWAKQAFGANSQLAAMIAAWMLNGPSDQLYALPVSATGAAATGTIAFVGTATSSGMIGFYIGGTRFPVPVSVGDTAVTIAARLQALIGTAAYANVPVSSVLATSTLTLTASGPGTWGNGIFLRINYAGQFAGEVFPSGIVVSMVPMSGGTGLPDFSGIATTLADNNWDFIVNPFTDSTSVGAFSAAMAARWSDASQAYGHVWSYMNNSVANLVAFGATLNDQHLTLFGGFNSPTTPWEWAAAIAGAATTALRADAARTVQSLTVLGVWAPQEADRFTKGNRQTLLTSGIATITADTAGTVRIERAVTTYQTNAYGSPDQSYLDGETMYDLMFITRDLRAFVTQTFPRSKLANDGTRAGAGSNVATPRAIKAALVARYATLEALGMAQNTASFAAGLVVQINGQDPNRVDVLYDPIVMGNLRIFAALNQFRLTAP